MTQKKLLYDIEQLIVSNGKETGICRVSLEVLRQIDLNQNYEVFPLVTTDKGADAKEYLRSKGLAGLAERVVYFTDLKRTTATYNLYKKLSAAIHNTKRKKKYLPLLNEYDEYISIFSPISPIVYESRVKTKMIVHDLIPLLLPQTCSPKFVSKFRHWMRAVRSDEVICVSRSTQKDFLAVRPDYAGKTKVAYLAAGEQFTPTRDASVLKKYGVQAGQYILSVSDHNPRKNFPHLIESFVRLIESGQAPNTSLVITGPKALDSQNIKNVLLKLPQYKERIILTGFVNDTELPALYSGASAFIYPSLYEGFGLPPLEAMKCGCPVICSNNSSLPEIAGDAALYISGKDINETANAMLKLCLNDDVRQEMIKKGFAQAEKFNWQNTVNNIFNV